MEIKMAENTPSEAQLRAACDVQRRYGKAIPDRLIAEVYAAMAAAAWQPIATAPRDGTPILTFRTGMQYVAWSDPDFPAPAFVFFTSDAVEGKFYWRPTHWMPLPAPPVAAQPTGAAA